MKRNFILITLVFCVFGLISFGQDMTTPHWEENYQFEALMDLKDGGSVAVDITNQGRDINECINKARSQAIYTIIFKGYGKTAKASASTPLAEMSKYSQNMDFFKNYLASNTGGLAFVSKATTNTSKPGKKIKKKLIETTTTVFVLKSKLREDLEKQGFIESAADIVANLGGKPSLLIVPDDGWMEAIGFMKEIDNQGLKEKRPDYIGASSDKQLNQIQSFIEARFGDVFDIKNLKAIVDGMANLDARDNMRSKYGTKVESDFDVFARSASADLWLKVNLTKNKIAGGTEQQYSLTFTALDPYTKSNVITTEPVTLKTAGDNFSSLLENAINSSCDNFRPRVINYFLEREKNGLNGVINFISANEEVDFKMTTGNFGGRDYPLERVLPGMIKKLTKKPAAPIGAGNETNMSFGVTIPTKSEDPFSGEMMPYRFNDFALDVINEIKKTGDFTIITEQVGVGEITILFIEEQ